MHPDLVRIFEEFIAVIKQDERCKGGWHYGSYGRGTSDKYSDYDLVFLVADADFEAFAHDLPTMLQTVCEDVLLFWGESFNDEHFKNYCSVIRIGEQLHQLDCFVVNADHIEAWMCRQHLKGCTRKNIIFDRSGEVGELLDLGYRTENITPDLIRAIDTYWLHAEMVIKYLKRRDIFKLLKNIDILFHAHVDVLLAQYDSLDWGSWESKVSHCVPAMKQEHLKVYFVPAEVDRLAQAIRAGMQLFKHDAAEACAALHLTYPEPIADAVIADFNLKMSTVNEHA